jgi:hypothetical protein
MPFGTRDLGFALLQGKRSTHRPIAGLEVHELLLRNLDYASL